MAAAEARLFTAEFDSFGQKNLFWLTVYCPLNKNVILKMYENETKPHRTLVYKTAEV